MLFSLLLKECHQLLLFLFGELELSFSEKRIFNKQLLHGSLACFLSEFLEVELVGTNLGQNDGVNLTVDGLRRDLSENLGSDLFKVFIVEVKII